MASIYLQLEYALQKAFVVQQVKVLPGKASFQPVVTEAAVQAMKSSESSVERVALATRRRCRPKRTPDVRTFSTGTPLDMDRDLSADEQLPRSDSNESCCQQARG